MIKIERITSEQASEIINTGKPIGLFWLKSKLEDGSDVWVGIDNSTGNAWTEDFKTKARCFNWLKRGVL